MGKDSFAEVTSLAQVMLSGMRSNIVALSKRGIDQKWIDMFEEKLHELIETNNEQEKYKSLLKAKTAEFDGKFDGFRDLMAEAHKAIKLAVGKPDWKQFGFGDKQ